MGTNVWVTRALYKNWWNKKLSAAENQAKVDCSKELNNEVKATKYMRPDKDKILESIQLGCSNL